MAGKSLADVKHQRRKVLRDAKVAGVAPPPGKAPARNQHMKGARNIRRPASTRKLFDYGPIEERYVKGYDKPGPVEGMVVRYHPSVKELADEFKLSYPTLSQRCTLEGWAKKREAWIAEQKRLRDEAELQAIYDSHLRIRTKELRAAERLIEKAGGAEKTEDTLLQAVDPSDLASLANALKNSQHVARVAMGLDDKGPAVQVNQQINLTPWGSIRTSRQEIIEASNITDGVQTLPAQTESGGQA